MLHEAPPRALHLPNLRLLQPAGMKHKQHGKTTEKSKAYLHA